MYRMLSILAAGVIVFFTTRETSKPDVNQAMIAAAHSDTVFRPRMIDKWPAVSAADAQLLAKQEEVQWKKNYSGKNILMGLGPNGAAKLKSLLASSDPETKLLFAQMLKEAELSLTKPLPVYYTPAQAMSTGKTQAVADNEEWQRWWGDQTVLMTVAARASDKAAYKQRLHDLVLIMCKFTTWGAAIPNADLAAGHISRSIALAWNWYPDLWKEDERRMIIDTVRTRMNTLCQHIYGGPGKAWWAGYYLANHNQVPVNGAAFCGVAFINDIPEASEWLAASWLNFQQVIKHSYADGSCAEGTAYFSATVSFILQFIEGTNGIIPSYDLYNSPFLKNAATYRINNSTPGLDAIICWGDSDPHDYAGPIHYLLRLSSQNNDGQARYIASNMSNGLSGGQDVKAWAWLWSLPTVEESAPVNLDYHATVSDMFNSRSGWKKDDYIFSFKSGYTNTLHSHLDAGSFALVLGRDWLLPMPGYGGGKVNGDFYDRNNGRWQYLSNSTEANNTLIIDQQQQRHNADARGTIDHYTSFENTMTAECDLTAAYNGATNVRRKIFHKRGEYIIVKDDLTLKGEGMVEWLLQIPPQSVVRNNTIDIEGKDGKVKVKLLWPETPLSKRDPFSAKLDLPKTQGYTLAASAKGSQANFIAVIEPKINNRETTERTFTVTPEGAVLVIAPGTRETILFADSAFLLTDKNTAVSAVARIMAVKTSADELSEVTATDATKLTLVPLQLRSSEVFDATIIRHGKSWQLTIGSGNNIAVKTFGGLKLYKTDSTGKSAAGSEISAPGEYVLE